MERTRRFLFCSGTSIIHIPWLHGRWDPRCRLKDYAVSTIVQQFTICFFNKDHEFRVIANEQNRIEK